MKENFKSGFVAIIGRPNVGKSTLMNHLIGQKIAITSKKPQTTRNKIQTVYTCEDGQIIFLDTPGIHKAKNKLGEYMVNVAEQTLKDVDVILWLVEPTTYIGAGEKHIATLKANYTAAGVMAECAAFIADMAQAYAEADLVLCRAGALTVAELACVGVASVLVPFPYAVDDHQTGNARFLAEAGAAVLMPQTELTPQRLAALLQKMNRERLLAMAVKARECAKPDATARVADVCAGLAA